ncbi:NTP transferase domain-containing protein [Halovenus sp. WSH3]|uniref:Probable molybdenum cofactor guanylyltransferase n=1 Tax=Halovenus carboxidivorans TaxID=2692199 RepID=A0A6B0TBD9_9EURY|nr:molybdenum cofactor guanylyltransferase [Halovenus carboxidivorans]MXR52541.1 NTP transferase domain-containing protein [Halovenus carboxidivorans]
MRSGVIVAGGHSTRFGESDKATAELAGTPMLRRVADRLRPVVDELVVNCREDQRASIRDALAGYPLPVRYALDEEEDRGPVAGIRNGLADVEGEYAAVVACDMPFVQSGVISMLFDRAEGHDGAVPRLDDGWFQTTQAVYRADAMRAACERALAQGDPRIVAPLEDIEHVVVGSEEIEAVGSTESFENINTREEFERAAKQFES